MIWYAVHTRSRHEKVVHQAAADRGMESFLPLREVLSQWKDRRKLVHKPLLPGYLFVHALRTELGEVTAIRGVVGVLCGRDNPIAVPDEQIQAVRRLVESPLPTVPWPYLRKGRRVRVTAGPLAGMESVIVSRKADGKSHLIVTIELLGRSVAAEIDPRCVEAIA